MSKELIEALRCHAMDRCGGQEIPTHIINQAAGTIEQLMADVEKLDLQVDALRGPNGPIVKSGVEIEHFRAAVQFILAQCNCDPIGDLWAFYADLQGVAWEALHACAKGKT